MPIALVCSGGKMGTALWPSVSGARARTAAVETVANNLANQNTPAFKKDMPTFKEYLSTLERDSAPHEGTRIPFGPIKDRDLYPLDSKDRRFVVNDGTYTDFRQGHLRVTQSPLDLALDGPGFFEVGTPNGVRYTRQGSLKMAMDGRLVTSEGFPVLAAQPGGSANAQPPAAVQPGQGGLTTQGGVAAGQGEIPPEVLARAINLGDSGGQFSVTESGEVWAKGQQVAKLSVVEFSSPQHLKKQGQSLFVNAANTNLPLDGARTVVRQGMVETSNVNPAEEMTNLIKAHRLYEHDMKAIKSYDELMSREANEIGKIY